MSFFDSLSIRDYLPVYAPSHLDKDHRAQLLKEGLENDEKQFINTESVFKELLKYMVYNSQHIQAAKSPEEKYKAVLKYINCDDAIEELTNHNAGGGEYLSNQYNRCRGLKTLLRHATTKEKK